MAICRNKEMGNQKRPTQGGFLWPRRIQPMESAKFPFFHAGMAMEIRVDNGESAFAFVHDASWFARFPEERKNGIVSLLIADYIPCK